MCDATSHSTQNGQRSHAGAGSIGASALDRKNGVVRSTVHSHQLSRCWRQRACVAPAVAERRPTHVRTSVLPASPHPRHAASAAADLVAAHSVLDSPVLSIEGARTYASGISMGAVAVFLRFSGPAGAWTPSPWALPATRCCRLISGESVRYQFHHNQILQTVLPGELRDRRLAHRVRDTV